MAAWTDTPLLHVRALWRPEQYNRLSNPGFEINTTGWSVGAGINAAGTSITRITTDAHAGSACGSLVTGATASAGVNFAFGTDRFYVEATYGTTYAAIAWLKSVSGSRQAQLILGSNGTASDRSTLSLVLRDAWTPYVVYWRPSSSRTDVQLALVTAYAATATIRVDDVALYQLDGFSQCENGNFLSDTSGWVVDASGIAAAATSITRKTTDGPVPRSQWCAEIVTTATSGSGADFKLGGRKFTSGRTYRLRAWLKSISGSTSLRLRLGSVGTAGDRGSSIQTVTAGWAPYEVDWTPSGDRTDASLALSNGAASVATFRCGLVEVYEAIDDVSGDKGYLEGASWKRGVNIDGSAAALGKITLNLKDDDARFDPKNTASPIYGALKTGRRVWGRASYAGGVYAAFFGTITQITPRKYDGSTDILADDAISDLERATTTRAFYDTKTYAVSRNDAFEAVFGARKSDIDIPAIENGTFFDGTDDDTSLLGYLEALNEATGSMHWVRPHEMADVLWEYRNEARTSQTDASSSDETVSDDFTMLDGYTFTSAALENVQHVPWQTYEKAVAADSGDAVTGYGYVMGAADGSFWGNFIGDDQPYLHFMSVLYGTDDNIPEATFKLIRRRKGRKRKVVRRIRLYPDAFVPFTLAAGESKRIVVDFAIAMRDVNFQLDTAAMDAAVNVRVTQKVTPTHLDATLFAVVASTVNFVAIQGVPFFPIDEETLEVIQYDSQLDQGTYEGPTINTPYIPDEGSARGLADYRNWLNSGLLRTTLQTRNRATDIIRDVADHLTITGPRWNLAGDVFLVRSIAFDVGNGGRRWDVAKEIQQIPAGSGWFTLDDATKGKLDTGAVLAY